jgi:hypothetical protein
MKSLCVRKTRPKSRPAAFTRQGDRLREISKLESRGILCPHWVGEAADVKGRFGSLRAAVSTDRGGTEPQQVDVVHGHRECQNPG